MSNFQKYNQGIVSNLSYPSIQPTVENGGAISRSYIPFYQSICRCKTLNLIPSSKTRQLGNKEKGTRNKGLYLQLKSLKQTQTQHPTLSPTSSPTSHPKMPPRPTITIIGGGISGLVLATGLLRRGIPIEIYEAAPSFGEIGLGLSLGPAAHRAMPLIDPQIREIYDNLVTTHADSPGYESFRETWFEFIWAGGVNEGSLLMDLKALPSGQTAVRRADFLKELVGLIPDGVVRFGKRLVELTEIEGDGDGQGGGGGIRLVFEDGMVEVADVVVGCDGIKSKVKEAMLPEQSMLAQPSIVECMGIGLCLIWRIWLRLLGIGGLGFRRFILGRGVMGFRILL